MKVPSAQSGLHMYPVDNHPNIVRIGGVAWVLAIPLAQVGVHTGERRIHRRSRIDIVRAHDAVADANENNDAHENDDRRHGVIG